MWAIPGLNTRETALVVWLAMLLAFGLLKPDARRGIAGLLELVATSGLIAGAASYLGVAVFSVDRLGYWSWSMTSAAVSWRVPRRRRQLRGRLDEPCAAVDSRGDREPLLRDGDPMATRDGKLPPHFPDLGALLGFALVADFEHVADQSWLPSCRTRTARPAGATVHCVGESCVRLRAAAARTRRDGGRPRGRCQDGRGV
jgi:hypothetical protein